MSLCLKIGAYRCFNVLNHFLATNLHQVAIADVPYAETQNAT